MSPAPTRDAEIEALRYLVARAATGENKFRLVDGLRSMTTLRSIGDAIADVVVAPGTRTDDEISAAIAAGISAGGHADLDLTTLRMPADVAVAGKHLTSMRDASLRRRQVEAIQEVSRSVVDAPADEQMTAIADAIAGLRSAAATIEQRPPTDLESLRRQKIAMDRDVREGRTGVTLDGPVFNGVAADYFAGWLTSGRIRPHGKYLIGGDSNSGKTSVADAIAARAMQAGIPVLYWQAELPAAEHLHKLQAVVAGFDRGKDAEESDPWPECMANLRYPDQYARVREVGELDRAVEAWVEDLAMRRLGQPATNGLPGVVVVDYLQLLDDEESRSKADYARLEGCLVRLAEIAARTGVAMVWLSQASKNAVGILNKSLATAKNDIDRVMAMRNYAETAYKGGGIRQSADVAFALINDTVSDPHSKPRRFICNGKERKSAFGLDPSVDRFALEFGLDRSGRIRGIPFPGPVVVDAEPEHARPRRGPSSHGRKPAPSAHPAPTAPVDKSAEAEF